ncbi:hypothetical protein E2C01_089888 [Portunus trituberculatus]|uniref:Uncharacterized protein n=1 Tax=Portunus trituberculatus TaxID=210409 RepID=A0A5B7JNN4_PORTR|nr:hypothetical protein [Portunus trituberculatus]
MGVVVFASAAVDSSHRDDHKLPAGEQNTPLAATEASDKSHLTYPGSGGVEDEAGRVEWSGEVGTELRWRVGRVLEGSAGGVGGNEVGSCSR